MCDPYDYYDASGSVRSRLLFSILKRQATVVVVIVVVNTQEWNESWCILYQRAKYNIGQEAGCCWSGCDIASLSSSFSLNLNVIQNIGILCIRASEQASTRARAYLHNTNYYSEPTAAVRDETMEILGNVES